MQSLTERWRGHLLSHETKPPHYMTLTSEIIIENDDRAARFHVYGEAQNLANWEMRLFGNEEEGVATTQKELTSLYLRWLYELAFSEKK